MSSFRRDTNHAVDACFATLLRKDLAKLLPGSYQSLTHCRFAEVELMGDLDRREPTDDRKQQPLDQEAFTTLNAFLVMGYPALDVVMSRKMVPLYRTR